MYEANGNRGLLWQLVQSYSVIGLNTIENGNMIFMIELDFLKFHEILNKKDAENISRLSCCTKKFIPKTNMS